MCLMTNALTPLPFPSTFMICSAAGIGPSSSKSNNNNNNNKYFLLLLHLHTMDININTPSYTVKFLIFSRADRSYGISESQFAITQAILLLNLYNPPCLFSSLALWEDRHTTNLPSPPSQTLSLLPCLFLLFYFLFFIFIYSFCYPRLFPYFKQARSMGLALFIFLSFFTSFYWMFLFRLELQIRIFLV